LKRDVIVNGRPGRLDWNGSSLSYAREDDAPVEYTFDLVETEAGVYTVLIEGRSYEAIVLAPGQISVNGVAFDVEVFDPRSLRGRRGAASSDGPQSIAAPMPGKIVRVLVAAGDEVAAGQGLVVVEAMKMQNEMKSPRAGRVAEVKIAAGATVTAGEILLVIT
jgi:biotin carboxyl carrier protein